MKIEITLHASSDYPIQVEYYPKGTLEAPAFVELFKTSRSAVPHIRRCMEDPEGFIAQSLKHLMGAVPQVKSKKHKK